MPAPPDLGGRAGKEIASSSTRSICIYEDTASPRHDGRDDEHDRAPQVRHGRPALPGFSPTRRDGELLIRSETVFAGYYKEPEATADVLGDDGWLRSGDIASIDEDGFVMINTARGHPRHRRREEHRAAERPQDVAVRLGRRSSSATDAARRR